MMPRQILVIATLFWLISSLVQSVFAEDSGRRLDNLAWLKLGVGARAQALAGAFTARADDGTASYWNPAFLESFGPFETQVCFMALPMTLDRTASYLSYIQRLGPTQGSIAASWNYFRISNIEVRDAAGNQTGTMEDLQNAFACSYGLALNPDWKAGASLKYYLHQLSPERGSGIGLDLAAAYKPKGNWVRWEFGASLKDVSPGMY
jgi:hypothetical protein